MDNKLVDQMKYVIREKIERCRKYLGVAYSEIAEDTISGINEMERHGFLTGTESAELREFTRKCCKFW